MALFGEQPPVGTDPELSAYLIRLSTKMELEVQNSNYFPPLNIVPDKPAIGRVYYFAAAIATTPISGEGLWVYKSTGWTLIA